MFHMLYLTNALNINDENLNFHKDHQQVYNKTHLKFMNVYKIYKVYESI